MKLAAALLSVAVVLAPRPAAPIITSYYAALSPVPTGGATALAVGVSDSPATFVWSATGGSISGTGAAVVWTAPAAAGTYSITVQVTGPSGSESSSLQVTAIAGLSVWPSTPPAGCPFPPSDLVPGMAFTGVFASQHFADTWYPSWGADGSLYSPFMDGILLTPGFTQDVLGGPGKPGDAQAAADPARLGWARLAGDSPTNLEVVDAGLIEAGRGPYGGRYASASLHHHGVWYYGSYATTNEAPENGGFITIDGVDYNWGVCGPLVGFHTSTDGGHSWTAPPQTPDTPIFGEPSVYRGKVKFATPHFVDFGRNLEHSPDGKAYLIAHGAMDPDPSPRRGNVSWITGDQIFLARVTPTPQNINDPSKWEFFAGGGAWSANLADARPVIDWNNNCGGVTMTWFPPLNRFITCIVDGRTTAANMNTYLLESPTMTGPFKLITYMTDFGPQAYFVNFPSKFISGDGLTAWMWHSANFHPLERPNGVNPPGSGYHLCSREVRFQQPVVAVGSGPAPGAGAPPPPPNPPTPTATTATAGHPEREETAGRRWIHQHCASSIAAGPAGSVPVLLAAVALLLVRRKRP